MFLAVSSTSIDRNLSSSKESCPRPGPCKGSGAGGEAKQCITDGTKPLFLQTPSAAQPPELTQQPLCAATSPALLFISFLVLILQLARRAGGLLPPLTPWGRTAVSLCRFGPLAASHACNAAHLPGAELCRESCRRRQGREMPSTNWWSKNSTRKQRALGKQWGVNTRSWRCAE